MQFSVRPQGKVGVWAASPIKPSLGDGLGWSDHPCTAASAESSCTPLLRELQTHHRLRSYHTPVWPETLLSPPSQETSQDTVTVQQVHLRASQQCQPLSPSHPPLEHRRVHYQSPGASTTVTPFLKNVRVRCAPGYQEYSSWCELV